MKEINDNELEPLDQSLKNFLLNTKYITLESDEEINILYKITDTNIFNTESDFVLEIKWLNLLYMKKKIFYMNFLIN